ncbi:putative disease resistance protein [Acorus calamus]|uniref:Disease resistance protein n=1 Tax=Acorus calamus TaxID=4465 RepID=A0AAV9ETX0_ACOCL|nr:putative disease resistance protein [Acorus calamus]
MDTFFAGEIATELVKELYQVIKRVALCRVSAKQLKHSVEELLPTIQEIKYSGNELPQHRQRQLDELSEKLNMGLDVAKKAVALSRWNAYKSLQYARKMEKIERWVSRFMVRIMPAHVAADVHHARYETRTGLEDVKAGLEGIGRAVGRIEGRLAGAAVVEMMEGLGLDGGDEWVVEGTVMRGVKERVKEMLMAAEGGGVVGICGMGGCGKTTIARAICRDSDVREHFNNQIFFETVSQSPNLAQLEQVLSQKIMSTRTMGAFNWIPQSGMKNNECPMLVVLDDVWSLNHFFQLKELVSRIPGCKILVISRFKFPNAIDTTYELPTLGEEEALSIFCHNSFGQNSIPPNIDKKLVMQVVTECKGHPLALKVIGASLKGQLPRVWASYKVKLSRGESISEFHEEKLLKQMAVTLESLKPEVRECFLDLGSFPEDKKIPLDVLFGLWTEIHGLEEFEAFEVLVELCNKNLVTMVEDAQRRAGDIYSSFSEISVTQHDCLRDLALYMSNREPPNQRRRLIMPRRENGLPKDWERGVDHPFEAKVVSVHTGEMKESDWFHMDFPKAEVLILNFSSSEYFLPPFIASMSKLKSLVINNHGTSSARLHNLSVFTSMNGLRSLWLEKITIPPMPRTTIPLKRLRRISLVLCEVNESLQGSKVDLQALFPQLVDLNVDHCIDLAGLPPSICRLGCLENLSITNCHDLQELPNQLGDLNSLRILSVSACPCLDRLPRSISQLSRLKYLDISQCVNLLDLPEGLGQMTSLEKIDMRECSEIRSLPLSVISLRSLGHVVCNEDMAFLWKEVGKAIAELRVEVVKECFSVDWLNE